MTTEQEQRIDRNASTARIPISLHHQQWHRNDAFASPRNPSMRRIKDRSVNPVVRTNMGNANVIGRSLVLMAAVLFLLKPTALVEGFAYQQPHTFSSALRMLTLKEETEAGSALTGFPSLEKHPRFVTNNSDKRVFPMSPEVESKWESIVPKPAELAKSIFAVGGNKRGGGRQIRRGILGPDVTVHFDDPLDGARQLLQGCGIAPTEDGNTDDATLQHLASALSYFQGIVSFKADGKRKCKARIVASRGPVGTKCPRWHLDHVPVRQILSLVGPGCVYIPESLASSRKTTSDDVGSFVDRQALNHLDIEDTVMANRIIVPNETGAVRARPGEAVVLMGREWDTVGDDVVTSEEVLHAAAHKSPSLSPFEGRVLLTVDLASDA